jgi:hypothetical protein
MSFESSIASQKVKEFCKEASTALGYAGDRPVEFWTGCIIKYLSINRPENKYIRLSIPLTIFAEDWSELSAELCRYLLEHREAEASYRCEVMEQVH